MVVNKYAKYKQPTPAPEQEQEPAPQNKYRKYLQPVPTPAAPAGPSLRSETDAIIEEAAANIPGGFAAFDAKPADPARMKAMGYVPDPLAKSGYAKPRAPEAPIVDSGNTTNAFTDIARGLEAPIAGLTGNGLEGWAKTTSQDPVRGASEAVDFISPIDDLGRAYQGVKQAGAGLIEGDMAKAAEGAQQASIQGSYAALQMLPGSMTLKGVTGRAAPTTMAGAERAAVQASRAPQVVKPQAKPEPVLTPPSEAPKPFSAPPEPVGRGVVRRNLDRILGGGVGATLGGTGEAMAAPGDGDSGGLPVGAATGAAIGIFGPRALAAAGSRGFRAAARMAQAPGARAGFDERVAARAVRKALVSGGINTEQDALNAARAKFGDKPASVADLTQEGVGTASGLSRLPGATGEAARARGEDLIQNRAGRLERDIGGATGASPATIAGDVDRMVALAREQAKPAYDALKQQYPAGSVKSERLAKIEGIGSHIKAVDEYRTATKANEGRDLSDFEYWDLVKRDIDAKEQQLINSGATLDDIRVRKLEGARAALVTELDDLMKGYAAARELGGEAPKMNAAFKQGQGLLGGRYTAEDVSRVAESVTGQPLTALQAGVIRSMVGKTEGAGGAVASLTSAGARRKLERVFGKGPADEMQARFAADAAIVQNASRMNPNVGSVTSQAEMGAGGILPTAADLIRMGTNPMQTALAAMSKSGSFTKAQRDLMGQMLLEGVTPENVARIFAGKKPKGGTTPPAGSTTGLGGPARSGMSGKAEALGALGGTGLGFATAPDQNGDGVVDAQERMMGAAGGAISGVLGVKGLGASTGLIAKLVKGGKPLPAPSKRPPENWPPKPMADPPAPGKIRAYHGSKHEFDQFALTDETVGTGEGTQSRGYGLYFAERPNLANFYRSIGQNSGSPEDFAGSLLYHEGGDVEKVRAFLKGEMKKAGRTDPTQYKRALDALNKGRATDMSAKQGAFYEVDLDAMPDTELLDLDAPLTGQTEAVRSRVADAWQKLKGDAPIDPQTTGYDILMAMGNDKAASEVLSANGLKGVQFLDRASREAKSGTRNYVMFDPKNVEVRKRQSAKEKAPAN